MDRIKRSFRSSFRKRKDHLSENSKPHQWQADEVAVRSGSCSFLVKYLGCVEVFESRGMPTCEEALKVLRNSRRKAIRGFLDVTGDGLRVVDIETKGLIVDQTIEKVSFCAPDVNDEKGFSYICRDGTTRRWMCHGFHAIRDTGDRLSHAVGCAFAVCLEKKQKRDKETVSMDFNSKTSTFTRTGSFKQTSLTERLTDPQDCKPVEPPPIKPVHNPYAIERPHATPQLLQRQGSFRGFTGLNQTSPFKRQLSLRINDLPSNMERTRSHSLDPSDNLNKTNGIQKVTPIPEVSPLAENKMDSISALCKEVTQGLSLMTNNDSLDLFSIDLKNTTNTIFTNNSNKVTDDKDRLFSRLDQKESNSKTNDLLVDRRNINSRKDSIFDEKISIPNVIPNLSTKCDLTNNTDNGVGKGGGFNITNNFENKNDTFCHFMTNSSSIKTTNETIKANSHLETNTFDPFDVEWVKVKSPIMNKYEEDDVHNGTNPFAAGSSRVKAFQVKM